MDKFRFISFFYSYSPWCSGWFSSWTKMNFSLIHLIIRLSIYTLYLYIYEEEDLIIFICFVTSHHRHYHDHDHHNLILMVYLFLPMCYLNHQGDPFFCYYFNLSLIVFSLLMRFTIIIIIMKWIFQFHFNSMILFWLTFNGKLMQGWFPGGGH